jgi:hypothetical protein
MENKHTYYNHCSDKVLKSRRVVPAAYTIFQRIFPREFFLSVLLSGCFCRICGNSQKRSTRCEKIQWVVGNVLKRKQKMHYFAFCSFEKYRKQKVEKSCARSWFAHIISCQCLGVVYLYLYLFICIPYFGSRTKILEAAVSKLLL